MRLIERLALAGMWLALGVAGVYALYLFFSGSASSTGYNG